jgi:Tfp pilus assembly protein PilF
VWLGSMDKARMDKCVELIACGLYFHEYKKSFTGEFKIIYGFTNHKESHVNDFKYFFNEKFKTEFAGQKIHGANPEIFTHQILSQDEFGLKVLKMTFFEGSTILVLLVNKDADLPAMQDVVEAIEWESLNNLAQIMEISDNSNSLQKLNDHLTKFPPSTYYYTLKASTYQNLKQFEEAKRDYLNALFFDENNIEALGSLGFLYDKEFDNKEEARSCYEKVLTIEPNQTIVRLNLGVLLDNKFKDKEAAKNQYEIILSYNSNEHRAHNNLGNYYRDFSDNANRQKVIFHFERAIEINPLYIEAYFNYGSFLQTINQKEKSRVILLKAKELLKEEEPLSIVVDRLIDQTYN